MTVSEAIYRRRSIRKFQERQIPKEDLEKVLEAGLYAPNAGGGQRTILCGIQNKSLIAQLGQLNLARFDRSRLVGSFVSREQPSAIDDPTIRNGFYGAPTVSVPSFHRITSCTLFPMPSAARKIWPLPPVSWASPPASSPGQRRRLTHPWEFS